MGTGTYPRATFLQDGSLLGCYTASSGGNSILTTAKSTDNGASWSDIGVIAVESAETRDLDNCFVHQLPSGQVLAAFRNHDRVTSKGPYTFYRITVCYSDDNGSTWKFLTQAATSNTAGLGIWEPFMMDALDGSLMLYFSRETNVDGSDQDSILIRSGDDGKTWSSEQTISGADLVARDGMLGVARMGAGSPNLIAVFESLAPDTGIHSVISPDDGVTWNTRRLVYKSSVDGAQNGAPQVVYVGGTLVASFQSPEDDLTGPFAVKVVTSSDGGANWNEKTTIRKPCNWAGELALDNQSLLVLCESSQTSLVQKVFI